MTAASLVPQSISGIILSTVSTAKLTKAVPKARSGSRSMFDNLILRGYHRPRPQPQS